MLLVAKVLVRVKVKLEDAPRAVHLVTLGPISHVHYFIRIMKKKLSPETNTTVGAETSVPPPSFPQAGPSGQ